MSSDVTPEMWACLKRLARTEVQVDRQRAHDLLKIYDALVKKGYAVLKSTDDDDTLIEYAITPEGRQAWEDYNGESAR